MERLSPEDIIRILKDYRPYLLDLDRIVTDVKYGTITLEIKVHDGFVTDLVNHISIRKKYEVRSPKRRVIQ